MLPKNDQGVAYAREEILRHSHENGDEYHWQLDDDLAVEAIHRLSDCGYRDGLQQLGVQ